MRRVVLSSLGIEAVAVLALGVALMACSADPGGSEAVPEEVRTAEDAMLEPVQDAAVRPAEPGAVRVGSELEPEPRRSDENPFRNFNLSDPAADAQSVVRFPLRIENSSGRPIVLSAEAGAESVLVDSLAAGAALRVDFEARAAAVVLGWEAVDGSARGQVVVHDVADSVQVVRIEAPAGSR